MKRLLTLPALACALIPSVSCTKQSTYGTTGYAKVLRSAGRTDCEWVQLWEGGPKFAMFNVGSTISKYGDLVNKTDRNPDSVPGYCTENVGAGTSLVVKCAKNTKRLYFNHFLHIFAQSHNVKHNFII